MINIVLLTAAIVQSSLIVNPAVSPTDIDKAQLKADIDQQITHTMLSLFAQESQQQTVIPWQILLSERSERHATTKPQASIWGE